MKTLDEQGITGVDTNNWYALFAPAKTPPATVDALNKAVRGTLDTPAVRDELLQIGRRAGAVDAAGAGGAAQAATPRSGPG